jgi:hypothetical protein
VNHPIDIDAICDELGMALRATARLKALGDNFPALYRNAARALASLKMIEINIADLYAPEILDATSQRQKAAGQGPETAR